MAAVKSELRDSVAVLTINNPPLNLFGDSVFDGLNAALDEVELSDARAVLIHAEGDHFGCGVDVRTAFVGKDSSSARKMLADGIETMHRVERLPIPTICAVQGYCFAAALELVLRTDITIAATSATFAQVEQAIGATTFLGGAYLLAERCGSAIAKQICYTGDFYSADQFLSWKIINQVSAEDKLFDDAFAISSRIAQGPTKAHAASKKMIRQYLDHGIRGGDEILLDVGLPVFDTQDMVQGVTALDQKGSKSFRDHVKFANK